MPKLEDVREQATKGYMQRQLFNALKAKADELAARIKKGESFEAVAASAGAKVEHTAALDRGQAQQAVQTVGAQVLQAVFGGAKGDVVVAPKAADSVAVVRIDDVQSGPMDQLAAMTDTARRQVNGGLANDLVDSASRHAAKVMKPKIDAARAAQALGISPDQVEPAGKAPEDKPPAKKANG
jgi:peptidyl-prolyl cis-trans isomerase D